jgi:cysteine synthase A
VYEPALVDETFHVSTEEAEAEVRALARDEGLFVGWSTGAAVAAARRLLDGDGLTVVVIAPDGGQRYLSEIGRLLQ